MKKARSLKDFCQSEGIGIDVSKASLEVVGLNGPVEMIRSVKNDLISIERLAKVLKNGNYQNKIICESTGHYHLLLGLVFAEYDLDLRILNPLQSSKHAQSQIRKTKTDPVDGYVLGTMCLTERNLPKAARLKKNAVKIRLKQGQLKSIEKHTQGLQRSFNQYQETYSQLDIELGAADRGLEESIKQIKLAHKRLQKELEDLLEDSVENTDDIERLSKLPGFSRLMVGLVSSTLDRDVKDADSWVAYAGLDVSVKESGTWKGRGKLTKRGNSYLRKRLFCAAWGATMNYPEVKAYYNALKEKGRKHIEALNIIARKLLRIAYTILVAGKEYDSKIAFGV